MLVYSQLKMFILLDVWILDVEMQVKNKQAFQPEHDIKYECGINHSTPHLRNNLRILATLLVLSQCLIPPDSGPNIKRSIINAPSQHSCSFKANNASFKSPLIYFVAIMCKTLIPCSPPFSWSRRPGMRRTSACCRPRSGRRRTTLRRSRPA